MQPTRLWRLACLVVLGSAALASCGKDEGATPSVTLGGGGAGAGNPSTPIAGEGPGAVGGNASSGGSSTAGSATGGSNPNVGGDAGAGAQSPTGMAGHAGLGGETGGGGDGGNGPTTPDGEQLELCLRITGMVPHADAQSRAFATALFADCRIRWLVPKKTDLDEYRQQLVVWNLEFWGCQGKPVTNFGLVYGAPALSAGDADLLIELYLKTVNDELQLSTDERVEMKAALERLAEPLISSPSEQPSQSSCVDNTGGAAGAGGAP